MLVTWFQPQGTCCSCEAEEGKFSQNSLRNIPQIIANNFLLYKIHSSQNIPQMTANCFLLYKISILLPVDVSGFPL